uniref:EF-hand domain-containing protein n=1 Tax=Strongyloides venezuelensis TaxID=75913 RepID=A0A0K0G1E9_STRVS
MEVDIGCSHWRTRFERCIANPDAREEISELVVDLEKLALDMAKKKITMDPHVFIQWSVDLGLKTSNLEQAVRILVSGLKMNHLSVERLEVDVNDFREFVCYDQKKASSEENEENVKAAKQRKKERDLERKRLKWAAKMDELKEQFEYEKDECSRQDDFNVPKQLLRALSDGATDPFNEVYNLQQLVIEEKVNKMKDRTTTVKLTKKKPKKLEKIKIQKVYFDDPYFQEATSNYEEGNVCGLISLNCRRDIRGRVMKLNGKCNFDLKQHELGRPSWFIRDFHKVVNECLKEEPTKELYRVHSCFPEPPYNVDKPSGFIYENYKPFVPEVPNDSARRIYSDCMYINGLSKEDALKIYGIEEDFLEELNKLTKGEGNFNEIIEKLKAVIPKKALRELIWSDDTFDITNKDNLDKVYNPYHGYETIDMEFLPDLTRFEQIKGGKFRKVTDESGEIKVFFGRQIIPEEPPQEKNIRRSSHLLDAAKSLDMSQQINELSMANDVLNESGASIPNLDNSFDDLIFNPDRTSRMSFVDNSLLEEERPRKTDVMNFSQLPRGVDQSFWKYKNPDPKKTPRVKSSLSNKTTPRSKKRNSSTKLSQITPKSSRILRSHSKKLDETPLPQIKEEFCGDVFDGGIDDETSSQPGRQPESDIEEESGHNDSFHSAVDEEQSTNAEDDENQTSDNEGPNRGFDTPSMEVEDDTPVATDDENTLIEESDDEIFICNDELLNGDTNGKGIYSGTSKPSHELFKNGTSLLHNNSSDCLGPFGQIYDEDELRPIHTKGNIPKGYDKVVTDENAHSFGYMAMKYSDNAGKIKCTTNVTFVNAPLIKYAILDVLSDSQLGDEYCESFNYIMNFAKEGNYKDMDHKKLRKQFKKCLEFKDALENLRLAFKTTMKARVKNPLPDEVVINGHHTLRSLYYCVCQIVPQSKDNNLHYLTFINLLLHMNNRFEMTFIDPSTNMEPDGEAPITCYIKKHSKIN